MFSKQSCTPQTLIGILVWEIVGWVVSVVKSFRVLMLFVDSLFVTGNLLFFIFSLGSCSSHFLPFCYDFSALVLESWCISWLVNCFLLAGTMNLMVPFCIFIHLLWKYKNICIGAYSFAFYMCMEVSNCIGFLGMKLVFRISFRKDCIFIWKGKELLCISFSHIPSFHLENKFALSISFRCAYFLLLLSHTIASFMAISLK